MPVMSETFSIWWTRCAFFMNNYLSRHFTFWSLYSKKFVYVIHRLLNETYNFISIFIVHKKNLKIWINILTSSRNFPHVSHRKLGILSPPPPPPTHPQGVGGCSCRWEGGGGWEGVTARAMWFCKTAGQETGNWWCVLQISALLRQG